MRIWGNVVLAVVVPVLAGCVTVPTGGAPRIVVASDGSGDFKTVQAAVDAVPDGAKIWTEIYVRNGTYDGFVKIPAGKGKIVLRGEDREKTILQSSTFQRVTLKDGRVWKRVDYTVTNCADDVILADLTVRNLTYQKHPKAGAPWDMAVQNRADRFICHSVTVLGRHNAFDSRAPAGSRFYVSGSFIAGETHFLAIFDNSGVIENTTLCYSSVTGRPNASAIFKRGDPKQSLADRTKLVILNCTLTVPDNQRKMLNVCPNLWDYGAVVYYIGNTFEKGCRWGQFARVARSYHNGKIWVFIHGNKNMPPLGDKGLKNPEGGPMIQQITKEQADEMTAEKVLAGKDGWNPKKVLAQFLLP